MRRLVAVAAVLVMLLAGCTRELTDFGPARPDPDPVVEALLQQHAHDALSQWDATVAGSPRKPAYAPTYGVEMIDDTGQILNGRPLVLDAQVPFELPPTVLTWPDGTTRSVYGLTATQAFDQLVQYTAPRVCGGCPPARVTGASLVIRALDAAGGPVTAPAWEFSFAGSAARAIVPAVHPDEVLLPVPATADPGNRVGITPDKAWTNGDGRRLVVEFTGAPGDASRPCGEDYTPEPVFSDRAVVIIIHSHRYHPPSGQPDPAIMCPQSGSERQVAVDLPQPLGQRVLLDVRYGRRIPLIRSLT